MIVALWLSPIGQKMNSVSYTHLDVYKRQCVECSTSKGITHAGIVGKGQLSFEDFSNFIDTDVYKRQVPNILPDSPSFEIMEASSTINNVLVAKLSLIEKDVYKRQTFFWLLLYSSNG